MPGLSRSRLLSGACIVALALAWPVPGNAQDVLQKGADPFGEPEFLPVDEAFVLTARVTEDGVLEADWRMPDGYYLYRHQFGFETRDGTTLGTPDVPAGLAKTDEFFGDVEVFYGAATVRVAVLEPAGDPFEVGIEYQGCADYGLCYPPERKWLRFAAAGLDAGQGGGSGVPFPELVVILASALLGGLILNLMPCVFPVLSIKALSLLGEPEGRMRDATGFSAGVVATFVALGLVLVGLKSAGEAVGWGFQLQSPGFVTAMALLFFVLGLNLLGVLETPGFGVGGFERAGPFATGMLAVVVATPCTVPFMGAAVGYGLAQPAPVLLAVMAALGIGMALPYAIVAGVPGIARRLPRPGAWMATLKQVMAFPIFATVVWLVWVLAQQAGPGGAAWVLSAFVALGFLAWFGMRRPARLRPVWLAVVGLAVLSVSTVPAADRSTAAPGQGFDMQVVEAHQAAGQPVFLNFTASWCITCLTNEQSTLGTDRVRDYFDRHDIAYVKGDWTNADPAITEVLARFGRSGVPLYVYFPAEGDPVVLPQILTPGIVIDAIEAAG
ncbi:MAG: protein-disulfide reductase DsbD family protein [Gammaproteobacteria bacterium]|nr:protein-disulfide reductase DsbD family protein [Gammaproteobacteria bacterium]